MYSTIHNLLVADIVTRRIYRYSTIRQDRKNSVHSPDSYDSYDDEVELFEMEDEHSLILRSTRKRYPLVSSLSLCCRLMRSLERSSRSVDCRRSFSSSAYINTHESGRVNQSRQYTDVGAWGNAIIQQRIDWTLAYGII